MKDAFSIFGFLITLFILGCSNEKDETSPQKIYSDKIEGTWIWYKQTVIGTGDTLKSSDVKYSSFIIFTKDSAFYYINHDSVGTDYLYDKYSYSFGRAYSLQDKDTVNCILTGWYGAYKHSIRKDTLTLETITLPSALLIKYVRK